MSQSADESQPAVKHRTGLVDSSGNTLPQRPTWRQRWSLISAKTKIFLVSLVAIVAGTATLLGNLETIQNYLRSKPAPPSVPLVTVKLSNSQDKDVRVAARGDFLLWLPGPDAWHTFGKYELRTTDGNFPESGQITIRPKTTVTAYAKILNEHLYGRILERADCDISLGVRRVDGGLKFTENLPFSKEAIAKYYVPADVGTN